MFSGSPSGLRCYLHFNLFGGYCVPPLSSVAMIQTIHTDTIMSTVTMLKLLYFLQLLFVFVIPTFQIQVSLFVLYFTFNLLQF